MEISLNTLTERAEDFLYRLQSARFRHLSGLGPRLPLAALLAEFPELSRDETFLQMRQASESPRVDAGKKASLLRLLRFLASMHRLAAIAPSLDAQALELDQGITSSLKELTLAEGLERLPEDSERERRAALERDTHDALWERQTAWARAVDATLHSSAQLGFSSVRAQQETLSGVPLQPWLEAAEKLLASTDDAYRDLLGYALKKLDPHFKPAAACEHDLLHLQTAPWMGNFFRREDLLHSVTRTLDDLGLPANANGRLGLDADLRDTKSPGAWVAVLRVPDEVRISVSPRGGLHGYAELLAAFAEGQLWANGPRKAPVLDSRFPDEAQVGAVRRLFVHLLLDEGWLKRILRLPSAPAREAARLFAFSQLADLRRAAALLPYAGELYTRGPVRPLAEEYADRLSRALGVAVPKGGYLHGVGGVDPEQLRAATLEVAFSDSLRERFNEDFWRNPATGKWFLGLAAVAGVELSHPEPAALITASKKLVRVMGQ